MVNIMTLFLFPLYMALAVLPVALIGWIISNKAHNSEPGWMLVLLFILGCISCVPAFIGELFFQYVFGSEPEDFILLFIYIFFGIAFVEETVKWFCCYIVGFNNKAFDNTITYNISINKDFLDIIKLNNITYKNIKGIKIERTI